MAALAAWTTELDAKDPDYEHHMLEGLWLHQAHNVVDEAVLKRLLRANDFRARAAATACYAAGAIASRRFDLAQGAGE